MQEKGVEAQGVLRRRRTDGVGEEGVLFFRNN
jgi:hypothetical protein